MHPEYRAIYNAAFSEDLYKKKLTLLESRLGTESGFRLAETPVFLTRELRERLERSAHEILQILMQEEKIERVKKAIPAEWNVPNMDRLPSLTQVDMAIVADADGQLGPKLIELQGFPSLSAFEVYQAEAWLECLREVPGLPLDLTPYFSGFDRTSFVTLLREVLLKDHDPENVVLVDLEPEKQKTWIDFVATKKLAGIDSVCPTKLVKDGRKLYRMKDGKRIPIHRIYNRIVVDELMKKNVVLPFDLRDELDVEWVTHPNWFFAWSKYSLPEIVHPAVPRAWYLSDLPEIPQDLTRRYVLKPLFSFAGGGVNVEPVKGDIDRIPVEERSKWCLQEKIEYAPCIRAVDGGAVKFEIRMMFYRRDHDNHFTLGLNLCRLSRGKMLGVDFNKDFTWVGSSVALT